MNKLIEVAEELYKQIDKAQVHLINDRLNNDEEGKKSAISEMETAMCNAIQLLKYFIDRKHNIVYLSEVWHEITEEPKIGAWFVGQIVETAYDGKSIYYSIVKQREPKYMKQEKEIKVDGTDKTFATQVTNIQSDEEIYGSLLDKLFTTYKSKNADYGSAFTEMFDELGIDYAYGKLREKMNRIKVLRKHPNMVENEFLEDALLDTAGYAILTLVELKKRNNGRD